MYVCTIAGPLPETTECQMAGSVMHDPVITIERAHKSLLTLTHTQVDEKGHGNYSAGSCWIVQNTWGPTAGDGGLWCVGPFIPPPHTLSFSSPVAYFEHPSISSEWPATSLPDERPLPLLCTGISTGIPSLMLSINTYFYRMACLSQSLMIVPSSTQVCQQDSQV